MTAITRFEEIEAWQLARELTRMIYQLTRAGEFGRDYALREQIRRAAISVMSNIAEGFESRTQSIFIDLLGRARGSAGEVRSQLYIALDSGYLSQSDFEAASNLAQVVSGKIYGFMRYLHTTPNASRIRDEGVEYYLDFESPDSSSP